MTLKDAINRLRIAVKGAIGEGIMVERDDIRAVLDALEKAEALIDQLQQDWQEEHELHEMANAEAVMANFQGRREGYARGVEDAARAVETRAEGVADGRIRSAYKIAAFTARALIPSGDK